MTKKGAVTIIPEVLPAEPMEGIPELGPVDRFLLDARRSRSRVAYEKALKRAVRLLGWPGDPRDFPWHQFNVEVAMTLDAAMAKEEYAKRTRNQVRAAIRGVLEECEELELIEPRLLKQIRKRLRSEKPPPFRKKGGPPTDEELLKLEEACRAGGAVGLRDLVIYEMCAVLRRSEVAALNIGDVDLSTGIVWVDEGKGEKSAETALDPASIPLLSEWCDYLAKHGRTKPADPFVGSFVYRKNGKGAMRYRGERLSPQTIYDRCRQRCREAGLRPDRVTPHDYRRRYGTKHSENGTPLQQTQKLMRHSDPATTASYDHSGLRTAQKWAGNARLPWHRKAKG